MKTGNVDIRLSKTEKNILLSTRESKCSGCQLYVGSLYVLCPGIEFCKNQKNAFARYVCFLNKNRDARKSSNQGTT